MSERCARQMMTVTEAGFVEGVAQSRVVGFAAHFEGMHRGIEGFLSQHTKPGSRTSKVVPSCPKQPNTSILRAGLMWGKAWEYAMSERVWDCFVGLWQEAVD